MDLPERGSSTFHTDVEWKIDLNKDGSAEHDVLIKLLCFGDDPPTISPPLTISFGSLDIIKEHRVRLEGEDFPCPLVKQKLAISTENVFTFLSGREIPFPGNGDPINIKLGLKQENASLKAGPHTIVDIFKECQGLKPKSFSLEIRLPQLNRLAYIKRRMILSIQGVSKRSLRERSLGGYLIDHAKGGQMGTPNHVVSGRAPLLTYVGKDNCPKLILIYSNGGKLNILSLLGGVIIGIFINLLSGGLANIPWINDIINSFRAAGNGGEAK